MVNVFVPTTPNPTSGFLLFVPETEIVRLAMTVEEGVKLVISGGLITPPDAADPEARAIAAPRGTDRREGLDKPDRNAHV